MVAKPWRRHASRKSPSYHFHGGVQPSWTVLFMLCLSLWALWSLCFAL